MTPREAASHETLQNAKAQILWWTLIGFPEPTSTFICLPFGMIWDFYHSTMCVWSLLYYPACVNTCNHALPCHCASAWLWRPRPSVAAPHHRHNGQGRACSCGEAQPPGCELVKVHVRLCLLTSALLLPQIPLQEVLPLDASSINGLASCAWALGHPFIADCSFVANKHKAAQDTSARQHSVHRCAG